MPEAYPGFYNGGGLQGRIRNFPKRDEPGGMGAVESRAKSPIN